MVNNSVQINLDSLHLTDEQFYQICQDNRDLQLEKNAQGDLVIMPPMGGETGEKNSEINFQLRLWNKEYQLGKVFDSSTGFKLPNGADRSPDASWIPLSKWQNLTPQQRQKFLPLCPDFLIELRSPSDNLKSLQEKMREYQENGTRLGWLIDIKGRKVEIYRQGREVEILAYPQVLSGEDVLPEFCLNLELIW